MEDTPQFAKLVEADIREAWPHEAHRFTPWLAENLDHIGEAVGLRLEAEGAEVNVEGFSADILARDISSGSLVLIENQLEGSDHKHLGQIMTYLAGLDAKIVIWIAAGFHPAHLSAIKWLNEHTESEFAFFAIRVKVVRIGNSPFAPVFEVLERPNTWEKQLQAAASAGGRSEIAERRHEFWRTFVEQIPGELERGGPPAYTSNRWRVLDDLGLIISMYASKSAVGVFIRGPHYGDHGEARERLLEHEAALSAGLGVPLGTSEWAFFNVSTPGDYTDPDQRMSLIEWLDETASRFEQVLIRVFGGISNAPSP